MAKAQVIAEHSRLCSWDHKNAGKTVYDWWHYLAVIQRKPGALRNGAPFSELPGCCKRLQGILLKQLGGDRAMANMLALVLHHDEHWLRRAVEAAAEQPALSAAGVTTVLGRLPEGPLAAPLEPPPVLALANEPVANAQCYDNLRENYRVRYCHAYHTQNAAPVRHGSIDRGTG